MTGAEMTGAEGTGAEVTGAEMTGGFGSLCDVLPSVAAILAVPDAEDRLGLRRRIGPVRRVLVIVVDGLGYHLLPSVAPHAPLLASVLRGDIGTLDELACTLPSTTPTSLVSFSTGVQPGEHGILGFTLNVPGTDRVLTHISWRDDPPPEKWQPLPTWFQRIGAAGIGSAAVLPDVFAGSGLTAAAYRGARFRGVRREDDYGAAILDELSAGPGLVYGYLAALDTAAHLHGIASPEWARAASRVDARLAQLLDGLPPDAALIVTADHGGLDIAPDARLDIDADPLLGEGLRVVAGEPRMRHLHTVEGSTAEVLARWRGALGEHAQVLSRDDSIAAGWFGPVAAAHRDRIGDVVVMCTAPLAVLASRHEPPEIGRLVGFHGAATPVETAIPLISLRR